MEYFPSEEDPNARYKSVSLEVNLNKDIIQINRQTYSLLDFLGDIGGLLDALTIIGEIVLLPFVSYQY